jgi:hypothetical protein
MILGTPDGSFIIGVAIKLCAFALYTQIALEELSISGLTD